MQLIVAVTGHQFLAVDVDEHDAVYMIKDRVEKRFGLPVNLQILRCAGKQVAKFQD
jgi:hypothetical protein